MKKIALATTCLMALAPIAAHAEEGRGMYGSLDVGVNVVSSIKNTDYDADGTLGPVNGSRDTVDGIYRMKAGVGFGASVGYDFGNVRTDVQVSYARNSLRGITLSAVNGAPVTLDATSANAVCSVLGNSNCSLSGTNTINFSGGPKLRQLNVMGNVWYDVSTGSKIEPYFGGGAGLSGLEINGDSKTRFAWQIGAGVAYKMSDKLAVTVDVRHRQVGGFTVADSAVSGSQIGKVKTTSFGIGLRANF